MARTVKQKATGDTGEGDGTKVTPTTIKEAIRWRETR